ncbi:MAG: sugar phosphate nucleotidyltransferase [Candidatus Poribacteria bacterium]|nr:sugar phosphate nucleotidyltransferase [Candidatus Poribacteria bacterium]
MQAIILCGGLSTRLGSITEHVPKILLEIGDSTVLDYQLRLLKETGVDEVVLASGHLHDVLYSEVGGSNRGVRIHYAREEIRLGTGGAIKNAMRYISTSPFFVLNGDILIKDFPLSGLRRQFRSEMDGLLLGVYTQNISSYGEILSDGDGKVTAFQEKQATKRSGYANGAIYLLSQSIAHYFPDRNVFSIERDVFPDVPNLYVLNTKIDWIDIGEPERLEYARKHFG